MNIHEAKTHLSRLLNDLQPGDEIILARTGTPIAKIVPLAAGDSARRPLGCLRGSVDSTFFEPLPEEELEGWG